MSFLKKFFTNPWVSPAGYVYKKHRENRAKNKRREKRFKHDEEKQIKRFKNDSKKEAKYYKNKVKEYDTERRDWMKKYGGEKFSQYPALNKGQQKLLDTITKRGGKMEKLPKLYEPQNVPGVETTPIFQAGQNALQRILQNPEQGYGEFKEPAMREFAQEIAPAIASRYGGQNSSGLQNRLASAGRDLGSKLGALRAGLQRESQQFAIPAAAQYAQQPYENRTAQENQRFLNSQQNFANTFAQNQFTGGLAQLGLGTNPYHSFHRSPTYLQPGAPVQGTVQQPMYGSPPVRRPSTFENLAGAAIPAFATAAGTALGGPAGTFAGNAFGNATNNAINPAPRNTAWGGGYNAPQYASLPTFGQGYPGYAGYNRGIGAFPGRIG